jgi:hypothetical protein
VHQLANYLLQTTWCCLRERFSHFQSRLLNAVPHFGILSIESCQPVLIWLGLTATWLEGCWLREGWFSSKASTISTGRQLHPRTISLNSLLGCSRYGMCEMPDKPENYRLMLIANSQQTELSLHVLRLLTLVFYVVFFCADVLFCAEMYYCHIGKKKLIALVLGCAPSL